MEKAFESTISADLCFCVKDRKWGRRMINWVVSPLLAVLLLASNGLYILTFKGSALSDDLFLIKLSKALSTFPWAIVLFLLGSGLLVLTVVAYERRMSYTEHASWLQD
jgi:membrane protein implicated in regulation of membrane protease activity